MHIENYIDGILCSPSDGKYLDNINPATKAKIGELPSSSEEDVKKAVAAAQKAYLGWSQAPIKERSRLLRRISVLILKNLEELAWAESIDMGRPITQTQSVNIPRASENFSFFADAITQFSSESYQGDESAIHYTLRQSLGVVACISPWNLPLYLLTWKIAPALAVGNTVVAKPSEITPSTAYLLSKICIEAGLPKGVLNIVHGLGPQVGEVMVRHPEIKATSFTGSTAVGRTIAKISAHDFKKVSLEMGGKNPGIIFNDCDFDKAVAETMRSCFSNQGQICLCSSRLFVERGIYEKFKNELIRQTGHIKRGDPLDVSTEYGPMASERHFEKVNLYIEKAISQGGVLLTGGPGAGDKGLFISPTLIEGLDYNCDVNQEEIFGPVVTITPFDSEEQVINWANSTEYGLAASIWTENISRAQKMTREIQAGLIWVNTWMLRDLRVPFGGVKNSGYGREGGLEALKFFTEMKSVCLKN